MFVDTTLQMSAIMRLLLYHGKQQRRGILVFGAAAQIEQDVHAIAFFKSPYPIQPCLLLVCSSHGGGSSGQIRCSSSSVWRRPSPSANSSVNLGEAQTIEQLCEEHFAHYSQWWDNRVDKSHPTLLDFKHNLTRKALWVYGWSTPSWMKATLTSVSEGKLHSLAGYCISDSQGTAFRNRLPKGNNEKMPTCARDLRQIVQGGDGNMHMQSTGTASEAVAVLKNLQQQGVTVDSYMCVEVLRQCSKEKDLVATKKVHECIIKSGIEQNIHVANNLLSVYIRCGSMQDARRVFDELGKKDVYSWTIMIGGYAQQYRAKDAYEVFSQMLQECVRPNKITYLSILKACASPSALKWGKEVHAYIRHDGLETDVRVGTALLKMYAKCGSIQEARQAFDKLTNCDGVSWTEMIGAYAENGCGEEAYRLLLQMIHEGFKPNAITFLSILNASASRGALQWVKEIHKHVQELGLEADLRVSSALVHMYAKSGSIDDARLVFNKMRERNFITWTVMIGAYAECGCGIEAYELYLQMKQEGFKPDALTYLSILNASASVEALDWVKEVHSDALEAGLASDLRVGSALVHMYAKSGSIGDARLVFDRMDERDVIAWNVMIGAYAEIGAALEAYQLFLQMIQEGFRPDRITYVSILNACASAGVLEWVKEVHRFVVKAGLESDLRVGNALVHVYAKSGSMEDARGLFDRMKERDVVTWNIMIAGLTQHGCGYEALEVFGKMNAVAVKPNGYSFVAVLSACSHAGLVDEGRRLFMAMMQDHGIEPTVLHYTCMVDLLGRAGHLDEAKRYIENMLVEPNEATWGALLGACRTYGNVALGEHAAKELLKLKPNNASAYVLLSNIYAAAGQWEDASLLRKMMHERGIHKEPGRSWIVVDNKIHDFVTGSTCHPEAKDIYAELSRLTEHIKAEGYIPDTWLVLHNIDEDDKELALCSHSEKLAITYGLMHTPPGNTICVYKNLRVCSDCHTVTKLMSKVTRREIVVRDANRFHHFKDSRCSCDDYW